MLKLHHISVLTEVTVTSGDTTEYLGMIGLFGFCISFVQSLVLEQDDIRKFFGNKESDNGEDDIDSDSSVTMCSLPIGFLLLFSFVGVTMLSYIGASRFLIISEAAFFNLSLLTGDLWSVVFSVVAERIVPQPLFFAALASVLSGVVLYEMAPSPAPEKGIKYEENEDYTNDGIIMLSRHENDDSTSNSSFNIINSPEDDNDE
jgi:solute carrier family 35 protein F1/2